MGDGEEVAEAVEGVVQGAATALVAVLPAVAGVAITMRAIEQMTEEDSE
jgi:hypothetical protein